MVNRTETKSKLVINNILFFYYVYIIKINSHVNTEKHTFRIFIISDYMPLNNLNGFLTTELKKITLTTSFSISLSFYFHCLHNTLYLFISILPI